MQLKTYIFCFVKLPKHVVVHIQLHTLLLEIGRFPVALNAYICVGQYTAVNMHTECLPALRYFSAV